MQARTAATRTPPPIRRERLTVISLGISPSLLAEIEALAAEERRSRAQMINILLDHSIAAYRKAGRKGSKSTP